MNCLRSFRLRCLSVAAVSLISIQGSIRAQETEPVDIIKVSTELVVFDAQVIDKKSKRTVVLSSEVIICEGAEWDSANKSSGHAQA